MKFRNPTTGEVFDNILAASDAFCLTQDCFYSSCPIGDAKSKMPCSDWCELHRRKAAKLMGYEVVEDDMTDEEFLDNVRQAKVTNVPLEHIGEATNMMPNQSAVNYGSSKNDPVNHPSHYTDGKIEVIDFIEDKKLGYHLGNACKYISRAGKKNPSKTVEDLKKAVWYINRYIEKLEEQHD